MARTLPRSMLTSRLFWIVLRLRILVLLRVDVLIGLLLTWLVLRVSVVTFRVVRLVRLLRIVLILLIWLRIRRLTVVLALSYGVIIIVLLLVFACIRKKKKPFRLMRNTRLSILRMVSRRLLTRLRLVARMLRLRLVTRGDGMLFVARNSRKKRTLSRRRFVRILFRLYGILLMFITRLRVRLLRRIRSSALYRVSLLLKILVLKVVVLPVLMVPLVRLVARGL